VAHRDAGSGRRRPLQASRRDCERRRLPLNPPHGVIRCAASPRGRYASGDSGQPPRTRVFQGERYRRVTGISIPIAALTRWWGGHRKLMRSSRRYCARHTVCHDHRQAHARRRTQKANYARCRASCT
jgi:hypothetical protein